MALVSCFRRPFLADNLFRLFVIGQQLINEFRVDCHRFPFSSSDGRLHSHFYTLYRQGLFSLATYLMTVLDS